MMEKYKNDKKSTRLPFCESMVCELFVFAIFFSIFVCVYFFYIQSQTIQTRISSGPVIAFSTMVHGEIKSGPFKVKKKKKKRYFLLQMF